LPGESSAGTDDAPLERSVLVACIAAVILVGGFIILSPTPDVAFTQLWWQSWKVNLTDLPEEDPILDVLDKSSVTPSSILVGSVLGREFYFDTQSLQFAFRDDLIAGPDEKNFSKAFTAKPHSVGDTILRGANSLFLESVDPESGHIMFWEYPRALDTSRKVRFTFVIANNLGEDHDYAVRVFLTPGNATTKTEKLRKTISLNDGERKTCVMDLVLDWDETIPIFEGQMAQIAVELDTGEWLFFWLERYIR
jgi:hypothetical protein